MKKAFKINIYLVFFLVVLFGFNSNAEAANIVKECIYQYDVAGSEHVSSLKFRILDNGKATSIVTSYNGKNQNNLERNTNWNDAMNDTFNKNKECPKYAMVAKNSTGLHVFVSYNEQALKDIANDKNYSNYFIEPLISSNNSGTLTDHDHIGENDNIYTSEDIENGRDQNNTGDVGESGGITFGDGPADCQYVLGQILDETQILFDIIKIIAPILVITFGSLDFVKATIAMDDKGMKTAMNKFPKRLMAAAALFFLPYLINLVLGLPGLGIENAVCGIAKVVFKLW